MDSAFPTDENGLVRQCAWCWRVMDCQGHCRGEALPRLGFASHGICPTCTITLQRHLKASDVNPESLANR